MMLSYDKFYILPKWFQSTLNFWRERNLLDEVVYNEKNQKARSEVLQCL